MEDDAGTSRPVGLTYLKQSFELCAVCLSGAEKGAVYGCIVWKHEFSFFGSWANGAWNVTRWLNNEPPKRGRYDSPLNFVFQDRSAGSPPSIRFLKAAEKYGWPK